MSGHLAATEDDQTGPAAAILNGAETGTGSTTIHWAFKQLLFLFRAAYGRKRCEA